MRTMTANALALTPESSGPGPRHLSLVGAGRPPCAIRVLIIHERRLVRGGLRALLERETDIAVVGEAASVEEASALVRRLRPDVLLVDVPLDEDPAELVRALRLAGRCGHRQTRTPRLRLIEGEHRWNSGT
jgi:CheY-like chemotaxis protein